MHSKNWMKHIESLALAAQDVPIWGSIPSFMEEFASKLENVLGTSGLKVTGGSIEWKKETKF